MYLCEAALAKARGDQRVAFGFLAAEADFASYFMALFISEFRNLLYFEGSVAIVEMVGVPDGEGLFVIFHFNDHVFDSAHLDNISGFCIR